VQQLHLGEDLSDDPVAELCCGPHPLADSDSGWSSPVWPSEGGLQAVEQGAVSSRQTNADLTRLIAQR